MPQGVSRLDEALLQEQLWTPAELRGRGLLKVWVDAKDHQLTYASGVSQWTDKSGFGNHLVQATSSARMDFDPLYLRGLPAMVEADQTNYFALSGLTVVAPYFLLIVFSTPSVQGGHVRMWNAGIPTTDTVGFFGIEFGEFSTTVGNGSAWNGYGGNTPSRSPTASKIAVGAMHNIGGGAGELVPYFNGTKQTGKTGSTTSVSGFWLGSPFWNTVTVDPTQEFIGGFHELIFCSGSVLNQREIDLLLGAAHWKWDAVDALAAAHPFKNRPPLIGD